MRDPGGVTDSASRIEPRPRELSAAKHKLVELLAKDTKAAGATDRGSPGGASRRRSRSVSAVSGFSIGGRRAAPPITSSSVCTWKGNSTSRRCGRASPPWSSATPSCEPCFVTRAAAPFRSSIPSLLASAGAARSLDALRNASVQSAFDALQRRELATPFDLAVGPLVRARLVRLGASRVRAACCPCTTSRATAGRSASSFASWRRLRGLRERRGAGPAAARHPIQRLRALAARGRGDPERDGAARVSGSASCPSRRRCSTSHLRVHGRRREHPRESPSSSCWTPACPRWSSASLAQRPRPPSWCCWQRSTRCLHRYTGETDIRVGTPVAGRTRVETEPLIGFFVNTLVLRGDLSGEPSFRDLLHRVRADGLAAFANPGGAVRASRRHPAHQARSQPHAALSGAVRAAECADSASSPFPISGSRQSRSTAARRSST